MNGGFYLMNGIFSNIHYNLWNRGFSRNAIKLSWSYGVGVQIFRFGNAVLPWPISSKSEDLDSNAA